MATHGKDIALDDDLDLKIVDGDFVISESDQQNIQLIFLSHKGEFKQWPLLGFGASMFLKQGDFEKNEFLRALKENLAYDGYDDTDINIDNGFDNLIIEI